MLGRLDEAEAQTELAEELAAPDDRVSQALWRQARAKLKARADQHAEGEALAREAVALFAATDMVDYHAHALADLAEVTAGTSPLEEAIALFERKGNAVAAERARAALVEISLAPG